MPGTGRSVLASRKVSPSNRASRTRPSGSPLMRVGSSERGSTGLMNANSARPWLEAENVTPTASRPHTNTSRIPSRLRSIFGEVAEHAVRRLSVHEPIARDQGRAGLERFGATRVESTARWRRDGGRDLTFEADWIERGQR